jgi:hypothetical protein
VLRIWFVRRFSPPAQAVRRRRQGPSYAIFALSVPRTRNRAPRRMYAMVVTAFRRILSLALYIATRVPNRAQRGNATITGCFIRQMCISPEWRWLGGEPPCRMHKSSLEGGLFLNTQRKQSLTISVEMFTGVDYYNSQERRRAIRGETGEKISPWMVNRLFPLHSWPLLVMACPAHPPRMRASRLRGGLEHLPMLPGLPGGCESPGSLLRHRSFARSSITSAGRRSAPRSRFSRA